MALNVVDLASSDDEDESPNKAAKSALDSFAPRKDRKEALLGKVFVNAEDEEGEDEDEDEDIEAAARSALDRFAPRGSGVAGKIGGLGQVRARDQEQEEAAAGRAPSQAAKSAPNGFQPRKERQSSGLVSSRFQKADNDEGPKQHPGLLLHRYSGRPMPRPSDPPLDRIPAQQSSKQHASGVNYGSGHFSYTPRAKAQELEKGSLAELLQQSQSPAQYDTVQSPLKSTVSARPRNIESFNERTPHAEGHHSDRKPNFRRPSPQARKKTDRSPQFSFPSGWSANQGPAPQEATLQRPAPLEIVDLFKKSEASIEEDDRDVSTRPFKRLRLCEPSPSNSTPSVGILNSAPKAIRDVSVGCNMPHPDFKSDSPKCRPLSSTSGQSSSAVAKDSPRSERKKKRTKPFHLRHKTLLKPSTDGELSRVLPQPAKSEGDVGLSAKKADPRSLEHVPSVQHSAERREPATSLPTRQPATAALQTPIASNFGNQYTPEEDALLAELREVRNIKWEDMVPYFKGRTKGSLQVRYSSKVSKRNQQPQKPPLSKRVSQHMRQDEGSESESSHRRRRKKRNNEASAVSGMVSWAEVKRRRQFIENEVETPELSIAQVCSETASRFSEERAYPKSTASIIRQREMGTSRRRACMPVPEELKERIFDHIGPLKYHKGTSGDVTCLAWSPDGICFAAGSIAISDERSMQYNRPGNLIIGSGDRLQELPDHHVPRPAITAKSNVNGLHAMRESQDPRLFMTVATVQFSPDGRTLYSAGTDAKVRSYTVNGSNTMCAYEIKHDAPLDLLSVSNTDVLATACHQSTDGSIGIYRQQDLLYALSPSRSEQQTSRAIYPSALRWGISHHHSNLLLAGFSIDSTDEERDIAGETCLWNIEAEKRIQLPVTRNVFDVAWNPRPSSTSTTFAVASTPSNKVSRGTRTVVQCFAPNQGRASRVLEWECPAFDLNDVIYCQHDDNLIAAGATDGKVYLWDQRFAGRRPTPLHVLEHGESLNVLDHDRPREIADTGIRFLSWGATSSRLYTGSSDGVVKIWNPYMATANAHIKDIATFSSAVMSGAFSPDYRDLLIGEDQGRINSLSVGHGEKAVRSMRNFDFVPAPMPPSETDDRHEAAHELLRSQDIIIRPMGDLPVRQAVQGPKYRGPWLVPSDQELHQARHAYDAALHARSDAHAFAGMLDIDDAPDSQAAREAERQVAQAGETFEKLQARFRDAPTLYEEAEKNQSDLHKAEKQRFRLEASLSREVEHCKLDCNYLPAYVDEDGDVADSGRSEGRIAGALRLSPPQDTALLTPDELVGAGLTSKCIACSSPAAKPKAGLPLCGTCTTTRRGLTAKCAQCSTPIRPRTESAASNVCEKCSFACFRCGKAARVSADKSKITCKACGLTWLVGVLGYELITSSSSRFQDRRPNALNAAGRDAEFGNDEMERLAARWGGTS